MIERIEKRQLLPHYQSAYRKRHSVVTALTKVLLDLICSLDKGEMGLLAPFDLSAAFDKIDHSIMMTQLKLSFGITDQLSWI